VTDTANNPVEFWLATFEVETAVARAAMGAPLVPNRESAADAKTVIAVEVLRRDDQYAVALSTASDADNPTELNCAVGFCNSASACDLARQWGFPAIEADIQMDADNVLRVSAPYFAGVDSEDHNIIHYDGVLLRVQGVKFERANGDGAQLGRTTYKQRRQAPDPARPSTRMAGREARVTTYRSGVVELDHSGGLLAVNSRLPNLAPLETECLTQRKVWSGLLSYEEAPQAAIVGGSGRLSLDAVSPPTYHFDDCEVLGFRIDLREIGDDADALLKRLVAPLNFHLQECASGKSTHATAGNFRYAVASSTIVIELLRYGKMRLAHPDPPLQHDDCQGQHELLVRILVGRVDDDTSQARDPAAFVPAIFVDNPWSKLIGRERQGFDKRLVTFFTDPAPTGLPLPLRPDGCWRGATAAQLPQPLSAITEVRPVTMLGAEDAAPILRLDCPAAIANGLSATTSFDIRLALGSSGRGGVQWRQTDFDEAEFRRSFAGAVVRDSLRGFRSIQVAPVDRRGLEPTWILGTFELEDVNVDFPSGVSTLEFSNLGEQQGGHPWDALCDFLREAGKSKISLPTGEWYQFGCSMKFTIDDGLDW
jgi:hypothetical protein